MRILFFSPYAFINVWAYPEAAIADNFRKRGHDVFQVRCKGVYSDHCIVMSSVNLTPNSPEPDRKAMCERCNARRTLIEEQFGFQTVYLEDYLAPDTLENVESKLKQVDHANWLDFVHKGIPVARYASYEYLLNEKISKPRFKPEQWSGFLTHVKNALITAEIGGTLLDDIKPDALLAYNTLYGCNHVMCALADERSIPHYTEHLGRHHRRIFSEMTIFRGMVDSVLVARSDAWAKLKDRPLNAADVALVSEHVTELLEATSPWVYTTKAQNKSPEFMRQHFGIGEKQKVLLVTMASGDERFAADLIGALPTYQVPIFPTQFAWIESIIEWVRAREDLFLIIRVHPREFPNKREQVTSAQAQLLRQAFAALPANCRINWPEDAISLHDTAKITDVCLNGTSTAGLEMLLFGIPVVIYDTAQFFAYPTELNICSGSVEDYWSDIDKALEQGRSARNVIGAFRWIAFLSNVAAIDISDVYGRHFADRPPLAATKRRRTLLSTLRGTISFRAGKPEVAPPFPDDPFMNVEGLRGIRNGRWLAYAVEHDEISHLDALSNEIASTPAESWETEYTAIASAAESHLRTVGISSDIFARPQQYATKPSP